MTCLHSCDVIFIAFCIQCWLHCGCKENFSSHFFFESSHASLAGLLAWRKKIILNGFFTGYSLLLLLRLDSTAVTKNEWWWLRDIDASLYRKRVGNNFNGPYSRSSNQDYFRAHQNSIDNALQEGEEAELAAFSRKQQPQSYHFSSSCWILSLSLLLKTC